jgi:hypothetical protein
MEKGFSPSSSESVVDVNACVSTSTAARAVKKETTFREWVVDNQLGMNGGASDP